MTSPYERRTRACQERLRDLGVKAIVLFPSPNLYYLTGFSEEPGERHLLMFVPADGDPEFLVPALYETQLREETWVDEFHVWDDGDDPAEAVAAVCESLRLAEGDQESRVLVDDTMHARFTLDLRAALPAASFGLTSEALAPLRVRKDDAEIDALRCAGAVANEVVDDLRELGSDAVGLTERELARRIEELLAEHGGEGVSFETIVGSGPNGAKPHHSHGDREIRAGDPVVLDFGTRVDGYPSDQTRTLVFDGDPPDEFERVHSVVREAQQAGVDAVEPGVPCEAVDAAAREVIAEAGFGDRFIHRTGHGVGLDVHEDPYIVEGNDDALEPGMVFSVEPGVYLPGEFGVRIEDLVVVTDDGAERLNHTDRGWQTD